MGSGAQDHRSRRWQCVTAAAACLLAAATLAGCGGGGGGGTADAAPSSAPALERAFVRVIDRVEPAVVQIETSRGLGSGVVFDDRGDIVTNAHVVDSARRFTVTLADGSRRSAKRVASFPPDDLAVIRVSGDAPKPARFADSSHAQVGDIVLAVGNPLGLRSSVTNGIISALGRTVSEPGGAAIPGLIQTSAAINPGNSGGALVDLDGRVVGIPTLAARDPELGGGAAPGIGFAIPADMVKDIAGQMVEHGRVVHSHRAYLGVQVANTPAAAGALVAAVESGGPADRAGIRPGDLLVAIAGHRTRTAADVSAALATLEPGKQVDVQVVHRDGSRSTLNVTLGQYPTG